MSRDLLSETVAGRTETNPEFHRRVAEAAARRHLQAKVDDLKARLRAVRRLGPVLVGTVYEREVFRRATDLRVRDWEAK